MEIKLFIDELFKEAQKEGLKSTKYFIVKGKVFL